MTTQDAVTLTRAQVEELRAIIHNADSPLGNRLQDVWARLYLALEGAGWTPQAADWCEPHPPSRHCMCPSCIPSFDDRFAPQAAGAIDAREQEAES
jgi:hypothetical protein